MVVPIDKHIGDAVMALFGAPRAHDDDPIRAARAALDVHQALNRLNETGTRPIQAHIGIASGEVVASTISRADAQDYTVLGDSVNLAARLVAAAGPGETLLSDGRLPSALWSRHVRWAWRDAAQGHRCAHSRLAPARHFQRAYIGKPQLFRWPRGRARAV
jgi:class 3 adenylate cyclase